MSIRYEREPVFCTHLQRKVVQLIEFSTPPDQALDGELRWIRGSVECLERKNCKDTCPGEEKVLHPIS